MSPYGSWEYVVRFPPVPPEPIASFAVAIAEFAVHVRERELP